MGILTTKRTWRRRPEGNYRRPLERLTPEQRTSVRRVIAFLVLQHGSHDALAKALGWSSHALWKSRSPSRAQSPRLAYAIARLLDVGVDAVLDGRWRKVTCPCCGETIVV
jgi:hypothetical protein